MATNEWLRIGGSTNEGNASYYRTDEIQAILVREDKLDITITLKGGTTQEQRFDNLETLRSCATQLRGLFNLPGPPMETVE